MLERESCGYASANVKVTSMQRTVVSAAKDYEFIGIVRAALRAQIEMVHIDKPAVGAARHDAAAVIATQDETPSGRWNALFRASWRGAHVGVRVRRTDVLSIAPSHFDRCLIHLDQLSLTLLKAALA